MNQTEFNSLLLLRQAITCFRQTLETKYGPLYSYELSQAEEELQDLVDSVTK